MGAYYQFLGEYYQFLGAISLLGARLYWGQDYHFMGDFESGARLLTYGGILSIFGGVIINYI